MVFILERIVLDALGPMYGLVVADGIQIVMVLVGIVGTYAYKPKYLVPYGTWQFLWIGWNIFLMCYYLQIGWLSRKGEWGYPLTLSLDSNDFFDARLLTCNMTLVSSVSVPPHLGYRVQRGEVLVNGLIPPPTLTITDVFNDDDLFGNLDWKLLYTQDPDCLARPIWLKLGQCAIQIIFSFFTMLYVCYIVYGYTDEDDCFDFIGGFDNFNPGYPEASSTMAGMKTGGPPSSLYQMHPQQGQPLPGMIHELQAALQQRPGPAGGQHSMYVDSNA